MKSFYGQGEFAPIFVVVPVPLKELAVAPASAPAVGSPYVPVRHKAGEVRRVCCVVCLQLPAMANSTCETCVRVTEQSDIRYLRPISQIFVGRKPLPGIIPYAGNGRRLHFRVIGSCLPTPHYVKPTRLQEPYLSAVPEKGPQRVLRSVLHRQGHKQGA